MPYIRFLADTDESIFGDYVTKLGVIWRWLQRNGFDFTTEYQLWKGAVADLYGNFRGERTIQLTGQTGYPFISGKNCPDTGIG
jgi:hypothetical protein